MKHLTKAETLVFLKKKNSLKFNTFLSILQKKNIYQINFYIKK